ncbi:MAG TPA: hypothetical protein VHA78_04680 [Candidatus Peribacteraceae bacterium]|nr:hypothetical protein [Candidatus Peribacteraceae bacterium]
MRTHRLITAGLLCSLLTTFAPPVSAQNITTVSCTAQTYDAMAHEQRLYRSVLFGQKQSGDLPVGSVRYDSDGNAWIKKGANSWQTLASGYTGTTWSDILMDQQSDVPARRGIFETRKTLTSDLIPPLTQAFRAFGCRLRAVCGTEMASQQSDDQTTQVQVQPVGCIEFTEQVLPACRGAQQGSVSVDSCENSVNAILDHERALLTLTIAYDSAYRTLLQFEGVFAGFLTDFQFPLLQPLWQTVRAVGAFSKLPCFLGQCDQ